MQLISVKTNRGTDKDVSTVFGDCISTKMYNMNFLQEMLHFYLYSIANTVLRGLYGVYSYIL